MFRERERVSPDDIIESQAVLVSHYMIETGIDVNDDYPCAKILAFRDCCMKTGHWKTKENETETSITDNRGKGGLGLNGR